MNPNRVLLMQLSERTVAFPGEPDRWGNPTWDVFVSEPLPRPEDGQAWDEGRDTASRPEQRPQQEPGPW